MLELDKVTRRFGERIAVADATIAIPAGQMVGIIGTHSAASGKVPSEYHSVPESTERA